MGSMRTLAAAMVLLVLAGCGSDRITDAASKEARECKQAWSARIDAFSAAGTAGDGTGSALDALGADKPKPCERLDDVLGARLVAELQTEYAARMSRTGSEISKQLTPAPTPSAKR
ncbi:MAG: hypothetical protein ACT4QG_21155 [Sporichthyaceae bacterium]